ncbi:hypothetical protein QJS10_CPB18g00705 [Acorus calamus]|uniref:Uncharacterized protein n=1 Tax=Acorus calamus TaxID=4465 RepID=A0AAV9CKQ7_ACOCL|nr:hypothetical protein QJS10_CPB18g00705 [Acorus calamus]
MILCQGEQRFIEGVMFVIVVFEVLSGLSINRQKSAFFGINMEEGVLWTITNRFSCPVKYFPMRYLGLPLSLRSLSLREWAPLVQWFERRLDDWAGRLMSTGGSLVLLQAVLTNLPIFMLSLFKIPMANLHRLDMLRWRFL